MEFISAQMIKKNIKLNSLICEIENIYKNEYNVPLRQVYNINPKRSSDQMMLMPAFSRQGYYGVKVLNVFENNPYVDEFVDEIEGEVFHDHYRVYDNENIDIPLEL